MSIKFLLFILSTLYFSTLYAMPDKAVDIENWTTENGARVYFVQAPELPMLEIRVAFDAGSARDGTTLGLSKLTQMMLNEGTLKHNADQIAAGFESIGAEYSSDVDRDLVEMSLRTLTDEKYLEPAVNLFAEVIAEPSFPVTVLKRVKRQLQGAIAIEHESVADIADENFYQLAFDKHPYANPVFGKIETIKKISTENLHNFYQQFYVARNEVIVLVGDIDRKTAEAIASALSAHLKPGDAAPALPLAKPILNSEKKVIPFESSQSAIRLGQIGINRKAPDYFPLIVANHVLGSGGFVSLLTKEVREKNGLSYSVYSYFEPLKAKGPFIISLETRQEKTEQAVQIIQNVLEKYITQGPTEAELTDAKKNLTGGFAIRLEDNKSIANVVLLIGFYGLPLNYLDTYRDKINAVTAAQIRDSLRKELQPNKMVLVQTVSPKPLK